MVSIGDIARPARAGREAWRRMARALGTRMPKGLYARSLIIIVAPIVLLQAAVVVVFMERHWQQVTSRLSEHVVQSIAALIDIYEEFPDEQRHRALTRIAGDRMHLGVSFLPPDPLPAAAPQPFFSLLDQTLSEEITRQIGRPYWIDTVGRSNFVEIRIALDDAVMRVFARRSQAYASNSHIFIVWMVGTSLVLLAVAIVFLRNQIRPIQDLADAAESFGKGRDVPDFRPRGAREVRRAAHAFMEMRARIERQIEQRTAMLAGVSHDLRTILTRFKLELALLRDSPEVSALRTDVDEMQRMLEDYLAFARGDTGEQPQEIDILEMLESLRTNAERSGHSALVHFSGDPHVTLRPNTFRRCLSNLVDNACRFGDTVHLSAARDDTWLTVVVEDDGPGVPVDRREDIFRPFFRLDDARNQDNSGTGLGLAIARDIARGHGGDIQLADSAVLGGLRATVRIPM